MSDTKATGPNILVVDDDEALQKLVVSLLTRAGMNAYSAFDGLEAQEALQNRDLPDLMLLDLMMPAMSGIEVLRWVRSHEEYDELPIVILSAIADPEQIREGLNAGADRYLTKPYLANNLVKTVREILEHGRH